MGNFFETWKARSALAKVLFILSIAYALSSIITLLLSFGIVRSIPGMIYNTSVMMGYTIISFAYGMILSLYHLAMFIVRRKRKSDYRELDERLSKAED